MKRTCFVMTPFSKEFETLIEKVIRPTIEQAGLRAVCGKSYEPGSIPDQIKRDISLATVGLAVLTSGNWNVAYEMGLAHMAAVPVIALIETSPEEIPTKVAFDVRHHRLLPYRATEDGYRALAEELRNALPRVEDESLLAKIVAPSSLSCERSVIAAAPLAYREARRTKGGWATYRATFSDHVGIKGLLRNLSVVRGIDGLPELWNPNDFRDVVLKGDNQSKPSEMTVYSIGSPKANRFTGLLMEEFFKDRLPRFSFVADETSSDIRDVRVSIKHNGSLYWNGIDPQHDDRKKRDIGLIVRGPNPFCKKGMMLVLAGRGPLGTEAACRAALEPKGVRMVLDHLNVGGNRVSESAIDRISDYSTPFWASVTMSAESTGESIPDTLRVQEANYFDRQWSV